MYEIFYLTMLISIILAGIISLVTSMIGRGSNKTLGHIVSGLIAISVVSLIGFAVTVSML